ncbi:MAG: ROK family glucokinase [Hungatella sp.]|nr:ROK family glucokinase [Hungatella sp.]
MYYIGVDLGGTNIAAGIVNQEGGILYKDSVPTGTGGSATIAKRIGELVDRLLDHEGIKPEELSAIGVGVPGTANQETGLVEYANNLGMEEEPFLQMLKPRFPGVRLAFENDANAAAYAEYCLGTAKGASSMLMVTLGTGIGGGMIFGGELFEGINYAAGEFGHFTIKYDGIPCNCGRRGCFEKYASATALVEQTKEAMEKHPESELWKLCGGNSNQVDGKVLFEGVRRGDRTAKEVLDTFTGYLGTGIIDLVNIFQPEIICLGGGISKAGELLTAPVQKMMARESYTRMSKRRPRIVTASLGNDAGIIGAALLAALLPPV